ncbi:MAG: hypothetical protein LBU56_00125 [Rickettsiales bacterium]|jgi:hypothetical protein|nr:hypothetical protein [Rickettsiales bacterium]
MVSAKGCQARVNCNYIDELQSKFQNIKFKRTEKTKNRYITNLDNKSTLNDLRVFIETQIKKDNEEYFCSIFVKGCEE